MKVKSIVSPLFLVGGPVRDELLGKEPKDYDFTTPLLPEAIENAIIKSGHKPYLIGKRFGTIGMRIDGQLIEITTFRTEKYAGGNRKPEVEFVSDLTTDLSRRDFTINAIARDECYIYDPFHGQEDLHFKVVGCVGKPSDRFKEDPLRMLRAARFASQLGFVIEENTEDMCKQLNYKILEISKERWTMELDKILTSNNPEIGLDFLMRTRLMNFVLPEISLQLNYDQTNPHHTLTLWEHTKKVVTGTPNDIELRWAALLHDIAKPFCRQVKNKVAVDIENTEGIAITPFIHCNYHKHDMLGKEFVCKLATYLRWSNIRRDNIMNLVANHMDDNSPLRKADLEGK
jgi:tRNA nucleotidyltransferase (CCA-adding enzyme)